jgi:hypothetical protein
MAKEGCAEHAALAARIEKTASDFNAKVAERPRRWKFNAKKAAMNRAVGQGRKRSRASCKRAWKAIQQASDDLNAQNKVLNDQIAADKVAFDAKNTAFQTRCRRLEHPQPCDGHHRSGIRHGSGVLEEAVRRPQLPRDRREVIRSGGCPAPRSNP